MNAIARSGRSDVRIPSGDGAFISAFAEIPAKPKGLVLFAHGSGSGRLSPRNQEVARVLRDAELGTLLLDLLTEDEEVVDRRTALLRFDIDFLARRLLAATNWARAQAGLETLPLGYFGASTGAAAAVVAAATSPTPIAAIVSRGGRPDLAGAYLRAVRAPTLLIVGGADPEVIAVNHVAMRELHVEKALVVVPGATHLFDEPGALEEVSRLARDWFLRHFT